MQCLENQVKPLFFPYLEFYSNARSWLFDIIHLWVSLKFHSFLWERITPLIFPQMENPIIIPNILGKWPEVDGEEHWFNTQIAGMSLVLTVIWLRCCVLATGSYKIRLQNQFFNIPTVKSRLDHCAFTARLWLFLDFHMKYFNNIFGFHLNFLLELVSVISGLVSFSAMGWMKEPEEEPTSSVQWCLTWLQPYTVLSCT